jgi:hypothetical protein
MVYGEEDNKEFPCGCPNPHCPASRNTVKKFHNYKALLAHSYQPTCHECRSSILKKQKLWQSFPDPAVDHTTRTAYSVTITDSNDDSHEDMSVTAEQPAWFQFCYDQHPIVEINQDGGDDTGFTEDGFGDSNDRMEEDIYVGVGREEEEEG